MVFILEQLFRQFFGPFKSCPSSCGIYIYFLTAESSIHKI